MSWHPQNLFNLHERTFGPESKETNFTRTSKTVFWQKWKSKAVTRGYHGDWIQEHKFKHHYLPASLPTLAAKSTGDRFRYGSGKERVPLAGLMYQEIERRLDVVIFRSCFADSVYEARRMVVHGAVKLNGIKCNAAWTRLHPGDLITVNPAAIPMLNPGKTWPAGLGEPYVVGKAHELPNIKEDVGVEPIPEADEDEGPEAAKISESDKFPTIKPTKSHNLTFTLPCYSSPFLFIPPYLEVSFRLCSTVFIRPPTSGPGYCEIPTPWDADGEVMRLTWEWYTSHGLGRRIRRERKEWDSLREMKQDPFAEGHFRKNSIGGRVAVRGGYEGGRIGTPRLGSGEPRLCP